MLRPAPLAALLPLLAACSSTPPASVRVASSDGPPVAAVGPLAPFEGPDVLLVVVGPFPVDTEIAEVEIAGAPGWGCSSPAVLRAGAWTAPPTELAASMTPLPVRATRDLGGGFEARRVALASTVDVEVGAALFVGAALDSSDACGAKSTEGAGRSWRRNGGAWTPVDGAILVTAIGYEAE